MSTGESRAWVCAAVHSAQKIRPATDWDLHQIDAGVISHVALSARDRSFIAYFEGIPSEELLEHCLNDLVMPRLLSLDEDLVLHAGVVHVSLGAIGFVGQSGAGKSTLTGSLHGRGLPILSDDSIILQRRAGGWDAKALSPNLRLFPDSIEQLFPDAPLGPSLGEYSNKRHVSVAGRSSSASLAALFVIGPPSSKINVSRLTPSEACMAIVANAFALDPGERIEAARRFANATAAAKDIPVFRLQYPHEYAKLPSVHDAIFEAIGINSKVNLVQ